MTTFKRTFGDGRTVTITGTVVRRGRDAVLIDSPDRYGQPGQTWLHVGTHTAPNPRYSLTTIELPDQEA